MIRHYVSAFALIACACVSLAQALPLDYFTRDNDYTKVKISPDGTYLAASLQRDDEGHLAFLSVRPYALQYGLRTGVEDTEIDDFHWVSPTRLIYTVAQTQRGEVRRMSTGEIFAVDRDGGSQKVLYGYRALRYNPRPVDTRLPNPASRLATAELVSALDRDDRRVLICEHPWTSHGSNWYEDDDVWPTLELLDVYTGKTTEPEIIPLGHASPVLDGEDHARFAIGYDKEGRSAAAWKTDKEWVAFALPGFRNDSIRSAHLTKDGRSVLFIGERVDEPVNALYRLDLESHGVEKAYAHPQLGVDDVIMDLSKHFIIGVRTEAGTPENHWLDPDDATTRLYQMLEHAFPGQVVSIDSATLDGKQAVAFVYSDVNPGDFYLVDTQRKNADFIVPGRSWVDPSRMRHKENIELKARDGLVLRGYLTRPRDESVTYPLVVLPHPGPHYEHDKWAFDWRAQLFANNGYAVLQVNYRGSDGAGEEFRRAGYLEWGRKMQDDLTDATQWAIASGIAEKDNVCIFGEGGYAGYAALMGAVREPGLYRCAASFGGITDLELYRSFNPSDSAVRESYLQDTLGNDAQALRVRSPVYHAEEIQAPILIVHAKNDRLSYEHATRMRDALEKAGKPVALVSLGNDEISVDNAETRSKVYRNVLDFLAQNLRGGRPFSE